MKRIITAAIIVIALAVPVWAEVVFMPDDLYGIYVEEDWPCEVCGKIGCITDHEEAWQFEEPAWVNPPELEARIAKLEAELQRVAAMVYTIHGPYGPTDWVTGISRNTCHVSVPNSLTQQGIDECLSQVTIEEEHAYTEGSIEMDRWDSAKKAWVSLKEEEKE